MITDSKPNHKQLLLKVTSATKVGNTVFASYLCDSSLLWFLFVSAQRRETTSLYLCILLESIKPVGRKERHTVELQSRGLVGGGKWLLNEKVSSAFT